MELDEEAASMDPFKLPITMSDESKLPVSVLFTGQFNGFGVEVKSLNEISLLYEWSCFGKGSSSRSKPGIIGRKNGNYQIMRKRQFQRREEWVKKFNNETSHPSLREKLLQDDIAELTSLIKGSTEGVSRKDVIDLISSDEEMAEDNEPNREGADCSTLPEHIDTDNIVIVVPNSDSEGEDYFANFKPKCCFSKAKLEESLMLTLQEAYFLAFAFGCLQILNHDKRPLSLEESWKLFIDTDNDFIEKYIVYHYFRSKGYVVKSGIKFGGDYLLYKEGPGQGHAEYIVVIRYSTNNDTNWLSTMGSVRMAGTTSKEILMAEVKPPLADCASGPLTPHDICKYSIQETILHRKLPCNNDEDDEP